VTFAILRATVCGLALIGTAHTANAQTDKEPTCFSGIIYDVAARAVRPHQDVVAKIRKQADVLFVGERHGVEAHPKTAACLIANLGDWPKSLVVEHIRADQQGVVDAHRLANPEKASGLGAALTWWQSGWPSWRVYEPLFSVAWIARLGIRGADVSSAAPMIEADLRTRVAAHAGMTAFDGMERSWSEAMRRAHCDLIDADRAKILALAQINRDLTMAQTLVDAVKSAGAGAIFFGGRAHARRDRSVPLLLGANLTSRSVSVALMEDEVPDRRATIVDGVKGQYDYVWFVGTAPKSDTCERIAALTNRKK
jgi:uncharacterized iron-regulated protein